MGVFFLGSTPFVGGNHKDLFEPGLKGSNL